jgi:RimJ/RimL family protein N-acetyltransferase
MTESGRNLLAIIKATTRANAPSLSIPVGAPLEAILRPVSTRSDDLNPRDIRLLTEWRNRFVKSFLTEFEANDSRTAEWLKETVGPDDTRILFMVDEASGRTVGYMGLAFIDWEKHSGEADAIVRGEATSPGLMTNALLTLMDWARGQLGLETLCVRVRSDNRAVEFYRKLGFQEQRRVSLRRIDEGDFVRWVEDESLGAREPGLVHMVFARGEA